MKTMSSFLVVGFWLAAHVVSAQDDNGGITPAGQRLTPTAAPGSIFEYFNPGLTNYPDFRASGGAVTVISPDKTTLVAVISGYNVVNNAAGQKDATASNEYIFIYDISSGKPVKKQVLQLPNSFVGAAFDPSGRTLYVGGGKDDNVHVYTRQTGGTWAESGVPISLGHQETNSANPTNLAPATAGLAVSADGSKVVVANLFNDSVSIVDPKARKVVNEVDLRPGKIDPDNTGVPGGDYPYGIAIKGNAVAYVSSLRGHALPTYANRRGEQRPVDQTRHFRPAVTG